MLPKLVGNQCTLTSSFCASFTFRVVYMGIIGTCSMHQKPLKDHKVPI